VTSKAKANVSRIADDCVGPASAQAQYGCGQQFGDFPMGMPVLDFTYQVTGD